MKIATKEVLDLQSLLATLKNGGVAILPSQLGYALVGFTEAAVNRIYSLKGRPYHKPSGVLSTKLMFKELTNSDFKVDIDKINYPIGVIEEMSSHHLLKTLPHQVTQRKTISFFMNMDAMLTKLAQVAWKSKMLLTITSCNLTGEGNKFKFEDLDSRFIKGADFILENDNLDLVESRGDIDHITATILDLTEGSLVRKGLFSERTLALAHENTLVIDKNAERRVSRNQFSSCMFMLSFKKSTYRKIKYSEEIDWLVLDLEDGCPVSQKDYARELIEHHLRIDTFDNQNVAIRLNELSNYTELKKDLAINYNSKIKGFALPMLNTAEDVHIYDQKITELESWLSLPQNTFKFFPIIETVTGLNKAVEIAKASKRNIAMFLGHADLFGDTTGERTQLNLHSVRVKYLLAAREAGIAAFDTPYENVKDLSAAETDAIEARNIGLDGKVALSKDQVHLINKVFKILPTRKDHIKSLLSKYDEGCQIIDGEFLAPPVVKRLKKEMHKGSFKVVKAKTPAVKGRQIKYGLDYRNSFKGQVVPSPYETTMDESWIMGWQSMVQTGNPLETSVEFCKALGLEKRIIPFQCLVNMGLCMAVESFSESSLFHLGISNVVYERAAYAGDTIRSIMIIDDIVPSSNKKYTVFKTRMVLLNQKNEKVVSMNRNSLFPYLAPEDIKTGVEKTHFKDLLLFELEKTTLRSKLLEKAKELDHWMLKNPPAFSKGELVLHSICKPLGLSNSLAFSTLYKNTHPLHINNARYGMEGLVVCGGFIIPLIHASASRDIRFALDHEIIDTMHINRIHHEDAVGAMSYILDTKVKDGIEEITLRTFGLKNIDAENDLANMEIPLELLSSPSIKPSEIELICRNYCPDLHQRICARFTWKLWRKAD